MYPFVNIIYSAHTQNMHSQRQALLQNVNPADMQQQAVNNGETINFLHYFTLPNNLNHNLIIQLPTNDTSLYQFQYAGENMINQWREAKKERARVRKQRKMAQLHRLLNRTLQQSHKLNIDGRGMPLWWWPVVEEWEEAVALAKIRMEEWSIPLKVKKEEPLSLKIHIKIEELPSPQLLYPSCPSRYTSLDPNTFDWGENAMVD